MKAIINVNLYDFYTYRPDCYLLFEEKIVRTGPMNDYQEEEGWEITDAKGAFLLPGLIIGHAHLCKGNGFGPHPLRSNNHI